MIKLVPALVFFCGVALGAQVKRPELDALFHAAFDDNLQSTAGAAAGADGIKFVEGKVGKAAFFGPGQFAEFRNVPPLRLHTATVEFWFNPDFERQDLEEHYFLRLLGKDGKDGLDVFFSVNNCGPKAVMTSGGKKAEVFADYGFVPRKWNQIVLAWETGDSELSGLRLYVNGKMRMVLSSFALMSPPATIRVGCKSPQEGGFANAAMDELTVYNRCLTELQVQELFRSVDRGAEKFRIIRKLVAEEDAAAQAKRDDFIANRKMAMIIGRTIGGLSEGFFGSIGLPMPDKIHEKDFETAELGRYDLLFFPGGGGYVFTEKAQQRLRDFITNGGGYVGICAGAVAARTFKLMDCKHFPFRERGSVEMTLKAHPITDGYAPDRVMWVRHVNGPFIEPSKDVQVVAYYNSGPPYAAIVAKQMGKGRVVSISPHPESDGDSRPLVRNSFYWAACVIGKDDPK